MRLPDTNLKMSAVDGQSSRPRVLPRVKVLGAQIAPLDLNRTVEFILDAVRERRGDYICIANAHTTAMAVQHDGLRHALNGAAAVVADGMPVVWKVRSAGYPQVGRVYGADLVKAVCAAGIRNDLRHGFFGGIKDTAELMAAQLRKLFPPIKIAGIWNPGVIEEGALTAPALLKSINQSECDVLWVGLGAPKQELWMGQHRCRLDAPVLIGVGQAFDIIAGRTTPPPSWMGRNGLEWLYRLIHEPRRLWRRYLIYNTLFFYYSFLELLGCNVRD